MATVSILCGQLFQLNSGVNTRFKLSHHRRADPHHPLSNGLITLLGDTRAGFSNASTPWLHVMEMPLAPVAVFLGAVAQGSIQLLSARLRSSSSFAPY